MPGTVLEFAGEIFGWAVVSADGKIADSRGRFPKALRFEQDQALFQQALDQADITVLGRRTHEAAPNLHERTRLVLSRRVEGVVRENPFTVWCNPESTNLATLLGALATESGNVVVAGGTGVYDLFAAEIGYDAFYLSVAESVRLPGGVPLFGGCELSSEIESRLEDGGLALHRRRWLDRHVRLRLLEYRRAR